jgi:hypothetical protein
VWTTLPSSGQPAVPPFARRALLRFVARMRASDFLWTVGWPASVLVVPSYPLPWRSPEDLPSSRLCRVHVLRSSTPVGSRGPWPLVPLIWPSVILSTSAPTVLLITGLNPFTLAHCGPSPPCVRFAALVTDDDATRGTRCLAKTSGARPYPWLTQPSFARRTSNGAKMYVNASSLLDT